MIEFHKVEGLGNHFVLVDERPTAARDWSALAPSLCARGLGVGSDGLLVVGDPAARDAAVRMRMFNPDGTEDMCGNGLRCVALFESGRTGRWEESLLIETIAGPRSARASDAGRGRALVRASLGAPSVDPSALPSALGSGPVLGVSFADLFPSSAAQATSARYVSLVSTGTPHCVILGPEPTHDEFHVISPLVECDRRFPERISVMWTTCTGPGALAVRPWERAVGETAACGTGAAAAMVAGVLTGVTDGPVRVAMRGGCLDIEWPGGGEDIVQSGPARLVFRGGWATGPSEPQG